VDGNKEGLFFAEMAALETGRLFCARLFPYKKTTLKHPRLDIACHYIGMKTTKWCCECNGCVFGMMTSIEQWGRIIH
jgi:hypothetical protein